VSLQDAEAELAEREKRAAALEAQISAVRAELDSELAEIGKLKIYVEVERRYIDRNANREPIQIDSSHSGETHKRTVSVKPLPISNEALAQACRGKSIPDSAIEVIRLAGYPLSEEEIVEGLKRAGVTFVSDRPAANVRFYLLKKRAKTRALKLTTDKKWDIDASYLTEPEPVRSSGFVPNRDRNEHTEKSSRGLLAARERGAKGGRRSKITPEMKETAEKLLAESATASSKKEIAMQIGVSTQTLQRWINSGVVSVRPSISLMITQDQRERLRGCGYSEEQIRNMKPEDAHRTLGLVN
jgi:hypothetical protein